MQGNLEDLAPLKPGHHPNAYDDSSHVRGA